MLHEALSGVLATLVAVILHELAHGLAALAMGDKTARDAGRLSLNPLQHIDKVGSVLLPAFLAVSQLLTIGRVAFMFGWAKPVPINAQALTLNGRHDPRRLMAIVALAGPTMNFLLAFIGALALYSPYGTVFWSYFIVVNLVLGIFNLIPLPPLDGGRVAVGVLPLPAARWLAGSEKFGILLVLLVVFVLPTVLSQLGLHFNPVNDALNSVLPWAADTVMHLAGHKMDSDALVLQLDGFEGPLDLLLELARAQKVDLAKISIVALVEQFLAVIEGARKIRLELAADWLVMAAWLTWLKSRLLVPALGESEDAEQSAEMLASRLLDLQAVRGAALWLGKRPQLGWDVFSRGTPEDFTETDRSKLRLEMSGLLSAYLAARRRAGAKQQYRPKPMRYFSVQNALERLARLVGNLPDWSTLEAFLPEGLSDGLQQRAALSATLVASLEMARSGAVQLRQEQHFGPILLKAGNNRHE